MTTQYLVLSFFFRTQVALNIEFSEKVAGLFSSFLTNFPANPLFYGTQSPLWSTIFSTPTILVPMCFVRLHCGGQHVNSPPLLQSFFLPPAFPAVPEAWRRKRPGMRTGTASPRSARPVQPPPSGPEHPLRTHLPLGRAGGSDPPRRR